MSRIEIQYIENGERECVHRQLIAGRLHFMGHEMEVNDATTIEQLSEFLGVKVESWGRVR